MSLIRAIHLKQWANTNIARDKLGELLRKLIRSSIPKPAIRRIDFLANESNQLPDWDGILDCDSQASWIPDGKSVWEIGTGGDKRDKIRRDFKKRRDKKLPLDWQRNDTTYVAVTLRDLKDSITLENELEQDRLWKKIKIYCAHDLEQWIESSPYVAIWLQEQEVGPAPSIHTLNWSWQKWSEGTQPKVSTKLVLADREQHAQELRSALKTSGNIINVQADSQEEALAFVYAAIDTGESSFREQFLNSAIVVSEKRDTDYLRNMEPQCIILRPPATENAQICARFGHTVVNALGNSSLSQKIDFRLRRPQRSSFTAALIEMGKAKEQAEVEARACGASPSIWRVWNLLQQADVGSDIPDWAREGHAQRVVPAILLGGWSDRFAGDREIVKEFTGEEFEKYRDGIQPLVFKDHPLLTRIDDTWVVTAPATAFALVINHITTGHLEKLSKIVNSVFKETDPTIDLHPDERPYAAMRTKGMRYSTWLRDGIAETLLRIVVIGDRLEKTGVIPKNQSCESYVDQLFRGLPGLSEDWRLLASLRNQLPVLAEAAPNPFLEALESLLQGEPEKIRPIFAEGDTMFGHAFHPNLLWALETLAWEPSLLGRVALILARLSKIDPGGRLSNRPINSLREILLAWHPNTSANLENRLRVLDLIIEREPETGWALLSALLPNPHEIAHNTHEPIWKDFGRSNREPVTRLIVWKAYEEFVSRALKHARLEPSRWKTLLGVYPNVAESHQQEIEKGLEELSEAALTEESRKDIWETLRKFVNRHRGFPESSWALSGARLDRLNAIKEHFTPIDNIDKIAWLFNEHFPDIPVPKRPITEVERALEMLRNDAIEHLWKKGGSSSLITLLDRVTFPGLVAPSLLRAMSNEAETLNVFGVTSCGTDNQRVFARYLSGEAYKRFGGGWTDQLRSRTNDSAWTTATIVNALVYYPDSIKTFELVSSFGSEVEQHYWAERNGWFLIDDSNTFMFAMTKMQLSGRALDIVPQLLNHLAEIDSDQILRIFDQVLQELNEGKTSRVGGGDVGFYIEGLFDALRSRNDVDKSLLARREYKYLPLLTRHFEKKDLTLHEFLATDPDFFVEVLCDLYRPASRAIEDYEISEEQRIRADFAWKLLQSWRQPPGVEKGGQANGSKLREWVNRVRLLASEKDRTNTADENIGKILFYFPNDPNDMAWPHIELRRLLEDLENEHIERGIEIEQLNSRGTTSRGVFDGGSQERELAKKWRNWADTLGVRWPRTKAMLDRIADSWEDIAKQEDSQAMKNRLQYG